MPGTGKAPASRGKPQEDDPKALKRTRGGRERLLRAAAELFGAHGLSATSLQMIADRLGVSKPAIYHHFSSRDEIVVTLMQPVVADTSQALEHLASLPPDQRPAATARFYTDFVVTHRRVIHMVFFDRAALPGDLPGTIDELSDAVAAGLAGTDDPDAVAAGTVLVYGCAALAARHPDLDDETLRHTLNAAFAALHPQSSELAATHPAR